MDLIAILRSRIDVLPEGDYTQGIKAVFQHVEVAARHLARGQSTADDIDSRFYSASIELYCDKQYSESYCVCIRRP